MKFFGIKKNMIQIYVIHTKLYSIFNYRYHTEYIFIICTNKCAEFEILL